jgi:hypothetical protein
MNGSKNSDHGPRTHSRTMDRNPLVGTKRRISGFSHVAQHVLPWLQPNPQARWRHRTGYQTRTRAAFEKYKFATCTCTSARASEFWKTAFWHMWTELNFSIHAPNTCAANPSSMHPHLCECLPIRGFSSKQKRRRIKMITDRYLPRQMGLVQSHPIPGHHQTNLTRLIRTVNLDDVYDLVRPWINPILDADLEIILEHRRTSQRHWRHGILDYQAASRVSRAWRHSFFWEAAFRHMTMEIKQDFVDELGTIYRSHDAVWPGTFPPRGPPRLPAARLLDEIMMSQAIRQAGRRAANRFSRACRQVNFATR